MTSFQPNNFWLYAVDLVYPFVKFLCIGQTVSHVFSNCEFFTFCEVLEAVSRFLKYFRIVFLIVKVLFSP